MYELISTFIHNKFASMKNFVFSTTLQWLIITDYYYNLDYFVSNIYDIKTEWTEFSM